MLDLLNENYSLLLFLQHFNVDFAVDNKSVGELCIENHINPGVFIVIGNLYNGFYPGKTEIENLNDLPSILKFLKNSHTFYKEDKYPELSEYLKILKQSQNRKDMELLELFFYDYFKEVLDHLRYEDEIAFPYFCSILDARGNDPTTGFSAEEYRNHHTDIETKLTDLKNLFLKHLPIKNELNLKRKFLNSLFGLEFDLKIHSMIEEKILIPVVARMERERHG